MSVNCPNDRTRERNKTKQIHKRKASLQWHYREEEQASRYLQYTVTRWREDPSLFKRGEGKDLPWREVWAFCIMNSMHVYINFLRTVRGGGGYFLELIKEAWLDFQFQTTRGAFQSTADRKWIPYMHWTRQMLLNLTLTWKENIFIFVSPPPHDH